MEFIKLLSLILITILLSSCGVKIDTAKAPEVSRFSELQVAGLTGSFNNLEGNDIAIENVSKPSVFIFASETCIVCREEGKHLATTFADEGRVQPKNVDFYTIMIGAYYDGDPLDLPVEIATDFANDLGIKWTMGYNLNDEIFNRLCSEGVTPCIITYNPKNNSSFKFIGETEFSKLQEATEQWEY